MERLAADRARASRHLEQRLDLRGERQSMALLHVIERLDGEMIPRQEQRVPVAVPDGEGEHAIESLQTGRPFFAVPIEDRFDIRA